MKAPAASYFTQLRTPCGVFSIAVDLQGRVVGAAFGDARALARRLGPDTTLLRDERRTADAREQVRAWFAGRRTDFDLRLSPQGSRFQKRVWRQLSAVPYGQTCSYGALARRLDTSARAVGRANATNPICLIVPCHRVVGADGSLTGYAFGTARKRALLQRERR